MKIKTFNELKRTLTRLNKSIDNMDNHQRRLYGSNSYDYSIGMSKALSLFEDGEYEAAQEILAILNIGIDILNMDIVPRGSQRIDSMTTKAMSNKPLTREILQANYRVSNTFNGVSLNTINDNLPVRLSDHALSKLIRQVFPEVQERKCTNDIKYNLEGVD